jgi:hypothetical protein
METKPVRTTEQKAKAPLRSLLALPPADSSLPASGKVVASFAMVSALAKKIEPVGEGYAKL